MHRWKVFMVLFLLGLFSVSFSIATPRIQLNHERPINLNASSATVSLCKQFYVAVDKSRPYFFYPLQNSTIAGLALNPKVNVITFYRQNHQNYGAEFCRQRLMECKLNLAVEKCGGEFFQSSLGGDRDEDKHQLVHAGIPICYSFEMHNNRFEHYHFIFPQHSNLNQVTLQCLVRALIEISSKTWKNLLAKIQGVINEDSLRGEYARKIDLACQKGTKMPYGFTIGTAEHLIKHYKQYLEYLHHPKPPPVTSPEERVADL